MGLNVLDSMILPHVYADWLVSARRDWRKREQTLQISPVKLLAGVCLLRHSTSHSHGCSEEQVLPV